MFCLFVAECGTSLGISLVYYACTNVPDELEIRVNHAGIEPSVPVGNEALSDFDYKKDCLKEGAFVNRAGVVGSHNGLNYGEYWDKGASQGRVVCFFREPKQRLISAFWHANVRTYVRTSVRPSVRPSVGPSISFK